MCTAVMVIYKYLATEIAKGFRSISSSSKCVAYSIEHATIE